MEPGDIKDRDTLRSWLKARPQRDAIVIAQRSALRVAPIWLAALTEPRARKRDLTGFPVLRQLLTSGVAAVYPTPEVNAAAFASAAYAAPAAYAASAAAAADAADAAAADAASAAAADAAERYANGGLYIWEQVREDARALAIGTDPLALPLWSIPEPDWFKRATADARVLWAKEPTVWSFWSRWWDGVLSGQQLPWDLQRDVALIPDEDWKKDPAHVAGLIGAIELDHATKASANAERVEVNPETGLLRLVAESDLAPDLLTYIRRKMAKARALLPDRGALAQHYLAIQPELDLLDDARNDPDNLPVELFDVCASVYRRVSQRAKNGECPTAEQDPVIADFLIRMRDTGADILANDASARNALANRNATLGNNALVEAAAPIAAFAAEVMTASEGRLRRLPELVFEATAPATASEDRKAASFKVAGRVIRVVTVVKAVGSGLALGGTFLTVEGLVNSPWANAALQAALKFMGFG